MNQQRASRLGWRYSPVALLSLVVLALALIPTATQPQRLHATPAAPTLINYPADALISVADYGANGADAVDDTTAIQAALDADREIDQDYYGRPKALFFPAGTYIVSAELVWRGCCVTLQGQGSGSSVIKLADSSPGYQDVTTPKAVIKTPAGNMSFRQNIYGLTINTGSGNPGAVGLDYIANNSGAVQDVHIISGDGQGQVGLAMTRAWPGPCLIAQVRIEGFDYGIATAHAEYGPTFEDITLVGQNIAGIHNDGNTLAIRKLSSTNSGPAIISQQSWASIIVLDATLQGDGSHPSAIDFQGNLYARNLSASGYTTALSNAGSSVPGLTFSEYLAQPVRSLFDSPAHALGLPIAETPTYHDNDLSTWAGFYPRWYGDTGELQALFDAGSATIYFPHMAYFAYNQRTINVPASVKRIVGFSAVVNGDSQGYNGGGIKFRVSADSADPLIIEQFGYGVTVEQAAQRPVAIKHGKYRYIDSAGDADLFLEDVEISPLRLRHPRHVWARQLNAESLGTPFTKVRNWGSDLWILGLKTEGKGPVIDTAACGRTELLGTLIYPVQEFSAADSAQPAFKNSNSSQSLIYSLSVYGANRNYAIQVEEQRGDETRQLLSSALANNRMSLFSGYQSAPCTLQPSWAYIPLVLR